MRKICTDNYNINIVTGKGKTPVPYDVKTSLISCLMHPSLKLGAREILLRNKIGNKIEESQIFVLLEDAEYEKLKLAFEQLDIFGQNDIQLIERVFDAEKVDVKEA